MNYYKATRPDGTDFYTGTVNYARALETGEVLRHPATEIKKHNAATYFSVSVEPADCTGFSWPCRLFRVEPLDRVINGPKELPNKRCCLSLRVVEELPAWQAFGPNGEAVVRIFERAQALTREETKALDAARNAAWNAAWNAARNAAWNAARNAARDAAWNAAWNAARAVVVRDIITAEQFDILTRPWREVIGATWDEVER